MSDRDSIARAVIDQLRREDDVRFAQQALSRDQEYQRSLGDAGSPDPNAMPFVKPQATGFPAQMYQYHRGAGFPPLYAAENTHEDMRGGPPQGWGWGDSPETAPGY